MNLQINFIAEIRIFPREIKKINKKISKKIQFINI